MWLVAGAARMDGSGHSWLTTVRLASGRREKVRSYHDAARTRACRGPRESAMREHAAQRRMLGASFLAGDPHIARGSRVK